MNTILSTISLKAGWIKFKKVVLGIDENNEYGYEITGATGNKNAKHNHIIGKHPNFLIGLREKWENADSANTKAIEHVNDRRLQAEARQYIDKLDNGEYFNPDRSLKQEFYSDWKKTNGNKYAREAFAELIGYDSENVDENTFNSTLLQAYRNGDLMATYMTWAVDYNDDEQEIGFVMRDLQGLAQAKGTEVKGLVDQAAAGAPGFAQISEKLEADATASAEVRAERFFGFSCDQLCMLTKNVDQATQAAAGIADQNYCDVPGTFIIGKFRCQGGASTPVEGSSSQHRNAMTCEVMEGVTETEGYFFAAAKEWVEVVEGEVSDSLSADFRAAMGQ